MMSLLASASPEMAGLRSPAPAPPAAKVCEWDTGLCTLGQALPGTSTGWIPLFRNMGLRMVMGRGCWRD